ncbi:unnamed protein product [Polarella glacialis]|uniref:Alpha-type protein kinase domain-containing protein n=2 Tax=Polarella glacialis TaxID=89957 RepID=A0A813GR52_POLGL|nr:unnamed protein product [Polarella glacialis]
MLKQGREDFSQLCLDLQREQYSQVRSADLRDLLAETELGQLVRTLACTEAQKRVCKQLVDMIVQGSLIPEFRPMEVYESGSFKKGTALSYDFDVDLVLTLHNFDHREMEQYMKRSRVALFDQFGDNVTFLHKPTRRCLKFEVASSFAFDLLFTGMPDNNEYGNPQEFYTPAGAKDVDQELILAKGQYPVFHPLVLVAKHWKNQHKGEHKLQSYYMELLCYGLMNERNSHHGLTLKAAFGALLVDFTTFTVTVQNPNRFSPQDLKPSPNLIREFLVYAQKTLQECFNAHNHPLGSLSLSSWQADDDAIFDSLRRSDVDNNNADSQASSHFQHEWEGECRYVARGTYSGDRRGQPCVVKWFKTGQVFEGTFWNEDLKAVEKASEIIDAFNLRGIAEMKIRINRPGVWTKTSDGQKVLVEPLIEQFQKFNSNTGYANSSFKLLQALSHFSYDYSGGKYLLCDLQGSFNALYVD